MKIYQFIVMLLLVFTSGLFISCEEENLPEIVEPLENPSVPPLSGSTWEGSFEGETYYIHFTNRKTYHPTICYFCKASENQYYNPRSDDSFRQMKHDSYHHWERDANTINFGSRSHDYDYGYNNSYLEYILKKAIINEEENSMDLYGREKSSHDEKLLMTLSRV